MLQSRKTTIRALRAAASAVALAAMTAGVATLTAGPAIAQQATVDSEQVFNALTEAGALANARNLRGALAKVDEAAAIPNKTPNDTLLVERTRYAMLRGLNDWSRTAASAQALIDTGRLPAAEVQQLRRAIPSYLNSAGARDRAIQAAEAYISQYGADADMHTLIASIATAAQNHTLAARHARAAIAATRGRPAENLLLTLFRAAYQQNDVAGSLQALEQLITHYPKDSYWSDYIRLAAREPGFDRPGLEVDVHRLLIAANVTLTGNERIEMAEIALLNGWPNQATRVLEAGFAAGVLGQGAEAPRQQRLLDRARQEAARFRSERAATEAEAGAAATGDLLVIVGQNYLDNADYARATALISAGLEKGGVTREAVARLHLGIAQLNGGQAAAARATFNAVRGGAGAERLAGIWLRISSGG